MKNTLLTATLLLASIALSAQIIEPTRYNLDSLHYPTTKEDYKYVRVVENYKNQPNLFLFTEYYRSGSISMKAISTNKDQWKLEGPRIDYYETGKKKKESTYSNNKINGRQIEWHENGNQKSEKIILWDPKAKAYNEDVKQFWNNEGQQVVIDGYGTYEYTTEELYEKGTIEKGEKQGVWEGKNLKENYSFSEIYNDGKFISGISADKNNNKFPYQEIMQKPIAEKGMVAFYQYVGKNYKTPKIQGLKGKIYITFVVDKDGTLTQFKILRDIGYGTGKEAIRILEKAEKWIPGKMRGIPTRVLYSLPISIQSAGNNNNNEPSFESEMLNSKNYH